MAFVENYYQKYDIFRFDKDKTQFQCVSRPIRKSDNYWLILVRIVDNSFDTSIDPSDYHVGDTTTFQSVAVKVLVAALLGN